MRSVHAFLAPSAATVALVFAMLAASCSAEAEAPVSNRVEMAVTEAGFVPQNISVHMGEPVTLIITRKTNDTCANEIVIDEHDVNVKLPLNQPVTVTFTPKKTGKLKYGCAMKKMIGGVITIVD